MNTRPDHVKICQRCEKPVRLTPEQAQHERDQVQTTCAPCRAVYAAEANEIYVRAALFPKAEATTSTPPTAVPTQ